MKLTDIERHALWEAWGRKCYYSSEQLPYNLINIDHIIPQSISPEELNVIVNTLKLPPDFNLHGFENLVPCLPPTNRRKSDQLLSDGSLLIALEHARSKIAQVQEIVATKSRLEKDGRILSAFLAAHSDLSPHELANFMLRLKSAHPITHLDFLPPLGRQYAEEGDLELLLNHPVGHSSVGMVNNVSGEKIVVSTVSNWLAAREQGYEPDCNASYKNTSEFIKMHGLIKGLKSARIPAYNTFKSLNLMSPEIVDFLKRSMDAQSVIDMTEWSLSIQDDHTEWAHIFVEIMRADFQETGQEELMLFCYSYALKGTAGHPDLVYLGKDKESQLVLRSDNESYMW